MTFGLTFHNNHLAMKEWSDKRNDDKDPTHDKSMAKMDQLSRKVGHKTGRQKTDEGTSCRHNIPEGKETMVRN